MAQNFGGDVARAAIGVGALAVCVLGDGVDGQVAACEVFFQRHIRGCMHRKAVIPACGFAFGAGQCIFLARVRVQEHREVAAHGLVALRHQRFRRAAHHHPVAVRSCVAHEGITHGTANEVDFHHHATNKRLIDLGSAIPNARKPDTWGVAMLLTFMESKLSRLMSVGPGAHSISSACSQPMA